MNPRARAVLIEAGITIGTGVALWALMAYGPDAVQAGISAWRKFTAPPLPMFELNELAVSDFRATIPGAQIPDKLTAENWGW